MADVLSSYLLLSKAAWDLQPPYEVLMSSASLQEQLSICLREIELSLIPENPQQGEMPRLPQKPRFLLLKGKGSWLIH